MIGEQPFLPWKVAVSIIHVFAILSTSIRLKHRFSTQRLWWDDYATIVPLLCEAPSMVVLWLRFRRGVPIEKRILLVYMNQFLYPTTNWWSKISISLAILRVTPSWTKVRYAARALPIIFVLLWISIYTTSVAICCAKTEWKLRSSGSVLICGPWRGLVVAVTVSEIVSDVVLIAIPLHQLWNASRRPNERRLIRLVFSSSAITAVYSLVLCNLSYGHYFKGRGGVIVWLMVGHIANALGIITSNLLVLTSWFRHHFTVNINPLDEEDIHITPHWTSTKSWHCAKRSTLVDFSTVNCSDYGTVARHVACPGVAQEEQKSDALCICERELDSCSKEECETKSN